MRDTDEAPAGNETVTREWIKERIRAFCRSPANTLGMGDEPAWAEPLVGFARGDDPLFADMRAQIGDFYWTPQDAFARAFPDAPRVALTVVSWVLPQTRATKHDNRRQQEMPSERWARSRTFGEECNDALHEHLVAALSTERIRAVAPAHLPAWQLHTSDRFGLCSAWSHRHAAYVAGLGTFGLCDGLITPAGKAMRCGSVVAAIRLEPTPRPYDDPHAYCLYFARGTCGVCRHRCPVGAITAQGHDKERCRRYLFETAAPYVERAFGFASYGCGLCQTGVPCESGIPTGCRPEPKRACDE